LSRIVTISQNSVVSVVRHPEGLSDNRIEFDELRIIQSLGICCCGWIRGTTNTSQALIGGSNIEIEAWMTGVSIGSKIVNTHNSIINSIDDPERVGIGIHCNILREI